MPLSNAQDFPLWTNVLVFLAAGAVVWAAGTRLTRYVDGIAGQTRLGRAFAGMLLLGGVTSLPEVANAATASLSGVPRLGVNNLLGSAAINVLLLAVADAAIGRAPVTSVMMDASTIMMGTLNMIVLVAVAMLVTTGDVAVAGGVGAGAVAICALSVVFFWIASGYAERAPWRIEADREEPGGGEAHDRRSVRALAARTAVAGAVIFAAGYTLSQTGDALAEQTGLGSGMVGFALIGISTSMPELSSIAAAFRIRRYEMAFGQVLGTNFINLSLVLLADACFRERPVVDELGRFEVVSALLGAVLTGIFMVGLLEHRPARVLRMGYDSLMVILVFTGGLALLSVVG